MPRRKPLFPPPQNATTQRRFHNKGLQSRHTTTINGKLSLQRRWWHDPAEGSVVPADAWLDAAEATISQGVKEMACRVNQQTTSFIKTAANLARTARIDLSKETVRQLVEAEGKLVLRAQQRGELLPEFTARDCQTEQGPTRLYSGCDGVKVPLVTAAEQQNRRAKVREKRQRRGRKCKPLPRLKPGADHAYKEFKVAYLYDETKQHRYVGVTSGNHDAAGRLLRRMSLQVQLPQAEETIGLIDGAPWIRSQFELHGLVKALGLDFYHLQEQAQKARRVVFGEETAEGKAWIGELMHAFKHEGYRAGWELVVALRTKLRGRTKRAALDQLLNYMAERRDMIRYPEFLGKSWQIGSGPTEAECKTTTWRVKGRGRRWHSDNAEAMMAIAALDDSRLWHRRWTTLDPARN